MVDRRFRKRNVWKRLEYRRRRPLFEFRAVDLEKSCDHRREIRWFYWTMTTVGSPFPSAKFEWSVPGADEATTIASRDVPTAASNTAAASAKSEHGKMVIKSNVRAIVKLGNYGPRPKPHVARSRRYRGVGIAERKVILTVRMMKIPLSRPVHAWNRRIRVVLSIPSSQVIGSIDPAALSAG